VIERVHLDACLVKYSWLCVLETKADLDKGAHDGLTYQMLLVVVEGPLYPFIHYFINMVKITMLLLLTLLLATAYSCKDKHCIFCPETKNKCQKC